MWLERDLARLPADMPVVTFSHTPFFSTAEVLNGYDVDPPAPTLITVGTFPSGFTVYTVREGVIDAGRFVVLR